MGEFQATLILVGLFALRCIAPLLFTLAVGYLMNRLVKRWEAQDAAEAAADSPPAVPSPGGLSLPAVGIPCWVLRNCEPAQRSGCPAYLKPKLACWLARKLAEGELPAACADCPMYTEMENLENLAPAI
jgi:hypothetical protein